MLISAIITYFFALLFLSNKFPTNGIRVLLLIICIFCVISCNLILIGMTIWDIYTRKKNANKRKKRNKKLGLEKKEIKFLEDGEYDFHYKFRELNVSSEENVNYTMNEIWMDLFSTKRIRRKLFLVDRKRKRISKKVNDTSIAKQIKESEINKKVTEMVEKRKTMNRKSSNGSTMTIQVTDGAMEEHYVIRRNPKDNVRIIRKEVEDEVSTLKIQPIDVENKNEKETKRNRFVDGLKKKSKKKTNSNVEEHQKESSLEETDENNKKESSK